MSHPHAAEEGHHSGGGGGGGGDGGDEVRRLEGGTLAAFAPFKDRSPDLSEGGDRRSVQVAPLPPPAGRAVPSAWVKFLVAFAALVVLLRYYPRAAGGTVSDAKEEHLRNIARPPNPPPLVDTKLEFGCPCRTGAKPLGSDGKCYAWCSQYGYCGDSPKHISGGRDCRPPPSSLPLPDPPLPSPSPLPPPLKISNASSVVATAVQRNQSNLHEAAITTSSSPTSAPSTTSSPWDALSSLKKAHQGVALALYLWDGLAAKHSIQYRLEYGSLLGMIRDSSIINHDTDADVLIDATSLKTLERLANDPKETFFLNAQSHAPMSRHALKAAAKRAGASWREDMSVRMLFRGRSHMLDFKHVPRTSCAGSKVRSMTDACSFSGPIARVLHFGAYKTAYLELYLSGCKYRKPVGQFRTWHCRKATDDCSFCPSTEAIPNSLMAKSGGKLARCTFSGVETWCPASAEWSKTHLADLYGPGWIRPNPKHKYSDNAAAGG